MKFAYFDNAATTYPKPETVYKFMDQFYREYGVNVGRGQYKSASVASKLVEDTRALLCELLNAGCKNVVFTPSATIALNIIIQGMSLHEGANIYITPFEHNAVTRILEALKVKKNIKVHVLDWDSVSGNYNVDKIQDQFHLAPPDVVVISHASNVCGLVCPVEKIFMAAKKFDAITILDMSQTAGLVEIELASSIYDYAVFAGHKTLYAPLGVAGFITSLGSKLSPIIYGGTGIESANQNMADTIPEKFEAGSLNIQAIAGLNASLKWIKKIRIKNIRSKEEENKDRLINLLKEYVEFNIVGNFNIDSIGVVSATHKHLSPDNIGQILNEKDVAVRTGLHCAPIAHKTLGTFPAGTVRFSVSYFTSDEDFKVLKDALDYIEENS